MATSGHPKQRGRNVQDILFERWPFSARLGILALAFALIAGIPLGILAALRQNSWADYTSLFFATIGVSVPSFVIGMLVIISLAPNSNGFRSRLMTGIPGDHTSLLRWCWAWGRCPSSCGLSARPCWM